MTDCLALSRRNICVENLANSLLLAAIFAFADRQGRLKAEAVSPR
ncbi:MAG: hypothetical protein RPU90_16525 [Candidatus Sedimenticola sp. (ex Thyasira tokunagai)]